MSINIVAVLPAYMHKVHIQWSIGNLGPGDLTYVVQKSGSPEGPWVTITTSPLINVYSYIDENAQLYAFDRTIYYKVIATNTVTNLSIESAPHNILGNFDRRRYLLWRKMNYDEEIMLRKGNGVPIKVVKKKHFGARCTTCYDASTGMILHSSCAECNGTGWLEGYYNPTSTWGHIKPSTPRTSETAQAGVPQVESTNAFLLNYPLVEKEDLIVEVNTNTIWRVESKQDTELIRMPVHQDIVLNKVPLSDVVYEMDLVIV